MTDVGTVSSGEDLLGSEEISLHTSSDVTGLNVLITGPLWRRGPEGGGSAWERGWMKWKREFYQFFPWRTFQTGRTSADIHLGSSCGVSLNAVSCWGCARGVVGWLNCWTTHSSDDQHVIEARSCWTAAWRVWVLAWWLPIWCVDTLFLVGDRTSWLALSDSQFRAELLTLILRGAWAFITRVNSWSSDEE